MPPRTQKHAALTFEESMARLEAIAARLEQPETGLEETISLVEEGRKLVTSCRKMLDAAELRLTTLTSVETLPPAASTQTANEDGFSLI